MNKTITKHIRYPTFRFSSSCSKPPPAYVSPFPLTLLMKSAKLKSTSKRSRTANPSMEDDDAHTDDDIRGEDTTTRPAQAERKRELERNRRNLVNVRFLELEAEIRRCAPKLETPATAPKAEPTTKCRRIDKEAVLKEAAQRLAVQRKEISSYTERVSNMTNEIDNLRAEKVELRSDKAYLRDELDTIRGDLQRLRADNIQLWQALKKQTSIKSFLSPDVAKLPADLFLRSKNIDLSTSVPVSSAATVAHTGTALAALARHPMGFPSPSLPNHPSLPVHSSAQQNNEMNHPTRGNNGDSYLVFQSPEELGELFTSYVPGSVTGFDRGVTAPSTTPPEHRQPPNEPNTTVVSQGLAAITQLPTQQSFDYDVQQPPPNAATRPPDVPISPSAQPNYTDKQEEDPFSDVAYCV